MNLCKTIKFHMLEKDTKEKLKENKTREDEEVEKKNIKFYEIESLQMARVTIGSCCALQYQMFMIFARHSMIGFYSNVNRVNKNQFIYIFFFYFFHQTCGFRSKTIIVFVCMCCKCIWIAKHRMLSVLVDDSKNWLWMRIDKVLLKMKIENDAQCKHLLASHEKILKKKKKITKIVRVVSTKRTNFSLILPSTSHGKSQWIDNYWYLLKCLCKQDFEFQINHQVKMWANENDSENALHLPSANWNFDAFFWILQKQSVFDWGHW